MDADRSLERITRADLKRLARIADEDRADFFARHPEFAILYGRRVLCTALCEEAALHYLNGVTGVVVFAGSVSVTTAGGTVVLSAPGEGTNLSASAVPPTSVTQWSDNRIAAAIASVTFH